MTSNIHLLIIFLFTLISSTIFGQSTNGMRIPISISYYGENAYHPGIKLGTYCTVWSAEKSGRYLTEKRRLKFGEKNKLNEINLEFNFGGYSHPNNHTGYFINTGGTFLHTTLRKKRQIGVNLEVGYLRRNYKFVTYELNADGEIQEVKGAGNNALLIGVSPQLSKEISIADMPVRLFIKPIFHLVHYVYRFQPNVAVEVGTVLNIHRKQREL